MYQGLHHERITPLYLRLSKSVDPASKLNKLLNDGKPFPLTSERNSYLLAKFQEKFRLEAKLAGLYKKDIARHEDHCVENFGLVADPKKPVWMNIKEHMFNMSVQKYFDRPTNMSYHNLCTHLKVPYRFIPFLNST